MDQQNFGFNFNSNDGVTPTLEQIRQALIATGNAASSMDKIAQASGRTADQLSAQEQALIRLTEWYKRARDAADEYRAAAEAAARGTALPSGSSVPVPYVPGALGAVGAGGMVPYGAGAGAMGALPPGNAGTVYMPFNGWAAAGGLPPPGGWNWGQNQWNPGQTPGPGPTAQSFPGGGQTAGQPTGFPPGSMGVQSPWGTATTPSWPMSAAPSPAFPYGAGGAGVALGGGSTDPNGGGGGRMSFLARFAQVQAVYLAEQAIKDLTAEMMKSIDTAATYEDRWLSISNTLGSLKLGKEQLEATRKAAFDTATSFDAMASGEQRLMNAGMSADKVIPTMTALSAISKANGASQDQFNNALNAYAQIQEKGTLQSEEAVRQLSNRYIPALQLYAKANNESTAQVIADMKAGKISADEFFSSVNKIAMTDFGAALEESTKSWHGVVTNLGNAIDQLETAAGTTAMQGALPGMQDLLETLRDPNVIAGAEAIGLAFGRMLGSGADALAGFVKEIARWQSDADFLKGNNALHLSVGFMLGAPGYMPWDTSDATAAAKAKAEQEKRLNAGVGPGLNFDDATGPTLDYTQALHDLRSAEDELRHSQELAQRVLDDRIQALRDQNSELDRQRTLQEKLRGLTTSEHDLRQAKMDAANIYTSYGRSQAGQVGALEDKVANTQQDISDMLLTNGNNTEIDSLTKQRTANQRTTQDKLYDMDKVLAALQAYGGNVPLTDPLYAQYRSYVPMYPNLNNTSGNPPFLQNSMSGNPPLAGNPPLRVRPAPEPPTPAPYANINYGNPSSGPAVTAYCPSCYAKFLLNDPRFMSGVATNLYGTQVANR